MSPSGCRPVLLVEGDGDKEAVPFLLLRLFQEIGRPDCAPAAWPIRCGDLPKLQRPGQVEKFVEYACLRPDGDSVLLVVDCDDECPPTVVEDLCGCARPIARRFGKRVGVALMHREFETLFLYSLGELAEKYPQLLWRIEDSDSERDWTDLRGAEEELRRRIGVGSYKKTRDQARFVSALDLASLRAKCRPAAHLASTLIWLTGGEKPAHVYPAIKPPSPR